MGATGKAAAKREKKGFDMRIIYYSSFRKENVLLASHIGKASIETKLRMAKLATRNMVEGLKVKRPPNLVNEGMSPS